MTKIANKYEVIDNVEKLEKALKRLREAQSVYATYTQEQVEKEFLDRLDEMVEQAFDDQCTGTNPRYPLMNEIRQMYLNAYYGGAKK